MHLSIRNFFALLLVVVAVFSGLACSVGKTSKIGSADLDKLNAARTTFNETVAALDAKGNKEARNCAAKADREGCVNNVLTEHDSAMRSAALVWAATYEQVATDASGSCQTSLKDVALTIRADAEKISGGSYPSTVNLDKSQNELAKTCGLTLNNKKK